MCKYPKCTRPESRRNIGCVRGVSGNKENITSDERTNIQSERSGKVINAEVCEVGRVSAALGAGVVTVGHGAALHDKGAGVAVHVGRVHARV